MATASKPGKRRLEIVENNHQIKELVSLFSFNRAADEFKSPILPFQLFSSNRMTL